MDGDTADFSRKDSKEVLAQARSFERLTDLQIDVQDAVTDLSAADQHLCRLLCTSPKEDIAKALGISRATLYRRIGGLQEKFERRGLTVYLKS